MQRDTIERYRYALTAYAEDAAIARQGSRRRLIWRPGVR
jgi:hypothetical protein